MLQTKREGSRKLFDAARRATFLETFAATCNVRLAAETAGVAYPTVFKHRMKDAAFAAAWDEALQQGYAYLEARLLEEVRTGPSVSLREPPPSADIPSSDARRSLEAGSAHPTGPDREDLQTETSAPFDVELALTLLREHARRLPGSTDRRKRQRTTASVATEEEVVAALTKRLKVFAARGRPSKTLGTNGRK